MAYSQWRDGNEEMSTGQDPLRTSGGFFSEQRFEPYHRPLAVCHSLFVWWDYA